MVEDALMPPDEYLCPITRELMENPVIAADGFTYERSAISLWLQKGHNRSPMTNDRLHNNLLTPNLILKRMIDKFRQDLYRTQRNNQVKVNIDEAIRFKEEVMKQAANLNNYRIKSIEDALVEERAKVQRLTNEIEEIKQRITEKPAKNNFSAPKQKIRLPSKISQNPFSVRVNSPVKPLKKEKNSKTYSVIFKTLTGRSFTLQVERYDTVAKIKHKIFEHEGIPPTRQRLIFEGRQWTDEDIMSEINIQDNSIVHLIFGLQPQSRLRKSNWQAEDCIVYVKTLNGDTIKLNVNTADAVENLKYKVKDHEGIPPDQQRLVFAGQVMAEDDWSLGDYGVTNECTVHLVLRLKGC